MIQNFLFMSYTRKNVMTSDKDALVQMVFDLQMKLKKKNEELHRARVKLNGAKSRMIKMKDALEFQRKRILELYVAA